MDELKASGKSFDISKREVWEAWERVKANKGAPGVDRCSIEDFEKDLKNNLYKIWNRMSSGSYFPPPVRAAERGVELSFRRCRHSGREAARGACPTPPGPPLPCTAREATEAAAGPRSNPRRDYRRSQGR